MKTLKKLAGAALGAIVVAVGGLAPVERVEAAEISYPQLSGSFSANNVLTGQYGFLHYYTFDVPTVSDLGAYAASFSTQASSTLSNFKLELNYLTGGSYNFVALGAPVGGGFVQVLTLSRPSIAAGSYMLAVSGNGGSATSTYSISSQVTPVPEPHEWAMMLAGLGLVGFVASRKRRQEGAPLGLPA